MKITGPLETRAHPGSSHQWRLSEAAIDQLVRDLPGKPVRVDYKGEPVGMVLKAERVDDGVTVTLSVDDAAASTLGIGGDTFTFAPALHNPDSIPQPPAGDLVLGPEWKVREVGAIRVTPPKPERPVVFE